MQITLKEVTVETVTKGRNKYQVANVVYAYNGDTRTQKIMSFANPDVFKAIQSFSPGDALEVALTKNEQGYTNWAKVQGLGSGNTMPNKAAPAGGKVVGSNYETAEERKIRQMYIIKQSSISSAIELLKLNGKTDATAEDVVNLAQEFVDFVYETPVGTLDTENKAIPAE